MKLLFLGQYPLENINSAPKVRTHSLYLAFQTFAQVTFITGTRRERRKKLLKYIFSGKLKEIDAVYLESATSMSMEVDLILLVLVRLYRKPLGIFIRDALPLFHLVERKNFKTTLLIWGWHMSIWFYLRCATHLFFPTQSFARVFPVRHVPTHILPPAGEVLSDFKPLLRATPFELLYVGGLGGVYSGIEEALKAIDELAHSYPLVFHCVCRPAEKKHIAPWLGKPWLKIHHMNFEEVRQLKDRIYLTVIPLANTDYARLAMPVKVFEYMSLGKPIVATDSQEMAQFITSEQIGLVGPCTAEAFKENIQSLLDDFELASTLAFNAYSALEKGHTWKQRAQTVTHLLAT